MPRGIYKHKPLSEETKHKLSLSHKGKKSYLMTEEIKNKISRTMKEISSKRDNPFKGKHHTKDTKNKWKITRKNKIPWNKGMEYLQIKGEKHYNWKGGVTELKYNILKSLRYKRWRYLIFARYNFTCQKCGIISKDINAHHKKAFSELMEENNIKTFEQAMNCEKLWDLNNGITLCKDCHKETDNYGFRNKYSLRFNSKQAMELERQKNIIEVYNG